MAREAGDFSESELDGAERSALEKAGRAIASIESAIASYEALKEKPEELRERIERLRPFHRNLSKWMAAALRAGGRRTKEERVESLRQLRRILMGWR
jgi:hypothetical protein